MSSKALPVVRTPDDLDRGMARARCSAAAASSVRVERDRHRPDEPELPGALRAGDGEPASVVVKLAADRPDEPRDRRRDGRLRSARSASTASSRTRIGGAARRRASCAAYDPAEGWFTLVLEDVAPARQGDQIAGCASSEARLAMRDARAAARAGARRPRARRDRRWLNQPNPLNQALLTQLLPGFLERYGDRIAPEHARSASASSPAADGWARRPRARRSASSTATTGSTTCSSATAACTVVDWQTVAGARR